MRTIEQFQIRKIYAIGNALGIKASGSEDELHALVGGVTGKDSIKSLTYQEACAVIARLEPEYAAEEAGAEEPEKPTQQARPTTQAMRNDEKTDTVQDRKADDPAVQPAAKVQPDKKITKKANRRPEKKLPQRETGVEREKFTRKG